MSKRSLFIGNESRASAWCACLLMFMVLPGLTWGDDDPAQKAEKDFGPIAAQSEWLKTPPLPAWTEKDRFRENDVEYIVVRTSPVLSAAAAEAELDQEMQRAAREWIRERFSPEVAENLEISPSTLRSEWMVQHEQVPCILELPAGGTNSSYPMYRSFAQLGIGEKIVQSVTGLWARKKVELQEIRQRDTLTQWSVIGGALLLLLASIHSYLRLDFMTRGYQTRRLQLVLGLAMAGIVGMSVWLLNVLI